LNRIFFFILLALCFFPPLVFKSGIYDYANSVKLAFLQVSSAVLLLVWAYAGIRRGRFLLHRSPLNLPLLLLSVLLTVSACLAGNRYEAFVVWQHWIAAILCFFVILNGLDDEAQIDAVFAALFASGACVALIGIGQYMWGWGFIPQTVPPASTFGNKNLAAQYVMLTLPLGLYFIVVARRFFGLWFSGIVTALMGVFLVFAGSRGTWLACGAELVFFFFFLSRRPWGEWSPQRVYHTFGAGCVAAVLFFVLINTGQQGFQWRLNHLWSRLSAVSHDLKGGSLGNGQNASDSVGIRLAIWRNTLEMIKDNPLLGVGLANHKVYYPLYHRKILPDRQFSKRYQLVHVHNDYLQFVAETGAGGVVFLLWFGGAVVLLLYRLTAPGQNLSVRRRSGMAGMALAGLAVNALFSFPMQLAVSPFFLMILLSTLAFQYKRGRPYDVSGAAKGMGIAVLSILILGWLIVYHVQRFEILRHFYTVLGNERQGDWSGILKETELASGCFPAEKKLLFFKAEAHLYMGDNRQAAAELEEYLVYYPYNINSLRNLGVVYARLQNTEKALDVFERYLKIDPDNQSVQANIWYLRQLEHGGL
jgi:O-antigen ligase